MMWFRLMMLFGSCGAPRALRAGTAKREEAKIYTVQVALNLIDPQAGSGNSIDIAVNGVRHVSRVHPTKTGDSVMLYHIPRGSVVTAHVRESEEACAYWVGTGSKQFTVGGWGLAFAISEESDTQSSTQMFEGYVKVVHGRGQPVTIEVNHATVQTFSVADENQVFKFPGLQKGTLVKVVSASGNTCIYRVGKTETKCSLDYTWALWLGAAAEIKNDQDEGVIGIEHLQNYTVKIELDPTETNRAPWVMIGLNGQRLARKMTAAKGWKGIRVYHVEGGSVITTVSQTTGEACGVYVGMNIPNHIICAGWTLNFTINEENRDTLTNYEVTYSVQRVSNTSGYWTIDFAGSKLRPSWGPQLFPTSEGDMDKGDRVVPIVNEVPMNDCAHEVGGNAVLCEKGGWLFKMQSDVNMRQYGWNAGHWSWVPDDGSGGGSRILKARMTASDTTNTKSRLECLAQEDFEFAFAPPGEHEKQIKTGHPMFKPKYLMGRQTKNTKMVKSATYTVAFYLGKSPSEGGFLCTVYDENYNKMCEADSLGSHQWTMIQGCTLEIEWFN